MPNYSITSKINGYIKRLIIEYKKQQEFTLYNILKELEDGDITIKTHEEYNDVFYPEKLSYAHTLVFLLPEKCFEKDISISNQDTISNKIKKDLSKIKSESNEYIKEVKFELKNETKVNSDLKNKIMNTETPNFWDKDDLKVFISHSVKNYTFANKLKDLLKDYDISCFVAHQDIEPTKKWQEEIIKALSSMELFLALITENFNNSWWTNQELGFALCRDTPIISIKLDQKPPPGFASAKQAITIKKKNMNSSSKDYLKLLELMKNKFPEHFKKNLLNKFLNAKNGTFLLAQEKFMNIINLKFNDSEIEKIVTTIEGPAKAINQLTILLNGWISPDHLKQLSTKKYKYYAELLYDKVLSQHTQKRYSIKRLQNQYVFEIIDKQAKTVKNQKKH